MLVVVGAAVVVVVVVVVVVGAVVVVVVVEVEGAAVVVVLNQASVGETLVSATRLAGVSGAALAVDDCVGELVGPGSVGLVVTVEVVCSAMVDATASTVDAT